jgi:hypothetical protein
MYDFRVKGQLAASPNLPPPASAGGGIGIKNCNVGTI